MTSIWFCIVCHASGVLEHDPAANVYSLLDWVTALHRAHPRAKTIACPQQGRDLRVFDDHVSCAHTKGGPMPDETPRPDTAPTGGTEPTPPANVQEIGRQIDAIHDKQTLLQVGRRWMRDAHNRGISRADVLPLMDEAFGMKSER